MSKWIPIEDHPPPLGRESQREYPLFGIVIGIGLGAILWLGGAGVMYLFWKLF